MSDSLYNTSFVLQCDIELSFPNEQAMMEFNLTTVDLQQSKMKTDQTPQFMDYFLVHMLESDTEKQAKTLIVTSEFCCLCKENVISYPLPDFELTPPPHHRYRDIILLSFCDVISVRVERVVGYDVTIASHSMEWKLIFRDYAERNHFIEALCNQFEVVNRIPLRIHCHV